MKKINNKGFSLVELLVAFTTITVLSFAIFRTVISIEKRQQTNIAYNDYVVFQSTINNIIQKDFLNRVIEAVEYCGRNCYLIKYTDKATITLSINSDEGTFTYDTTKIKLPKTFKFYRDIEQKVETFTDVEEGNHDSFMMFRIPIESSLIKEKSDLIFIYQYDSRINPIRSTI